MAVRTMDEGAFGSCTVGLRVDINSPVDEEGALVDDSRFQAHIETIKELLDRDASVVVMAHQGRPGRDDFTSLDQHANHLTSLLDTEVAFIDSVFSRDACESIRSLGPGEILCLENLRFASEELLCTEPEAAADTYLVSRLSDELDVYINDAFAVSHRSQPSVVGFPQRLPSFAGRLMQREIDVLGDLTTTPTPRAAVLGGAKIDDSLSVLERLLDEDLVEFVLVGGLVANAFYVVGEHAPSDATHADLVERGYGESLDRARSIIDRFDDWIIKPVDAVLPVNGDRTVVDVASFPLDFAAVPRDIGPRTVEQWTAKLDEVSTVICNGPVGQFEDDRFEDGTASLFDRIGRADYAIAGGGDTSAAISRFDIEGFDHVSTGGGAALSMLSGKKLPGITALESCTIELPH